MTNYIYLYLKNLSANIPITIISNLATTFASRLSNIFGGYKYIKLLESLMER